MEVTKEQFQAWKTNNVTEFVLEILRDQKEANLARLRGAVASGNLAQASRYEGIIEGIEELLEIEYEDPQVD